MNFDNPISGMLNQWTLTAIALGPFFFQYIKALVLKLTGQEDLPTQVAAVLNVVTVAGVIVWQGVVAHATGLTILAQVALGLVFSELVYQHAVQPMAKSSSPIVPAAGATAAALLMALVLFCATPASAAEYSLLDAHRFSYGVGGGFVLHQPANDQVGPADRNDGEFSASLGWSAGNIGTLVWAEHYGFGNRAWEHRAAASFMLNDPAENARTVGIAAFLCYTWRDDRFGADPSSEPGGGLSLSFPAGFANAHVGASVDCGFKTRSAEARLGVQAIGGLKR